MAKFLYNTSNIYTLLFKGGSIEIKPLKYIKLEDGDFPGIYASAIDSKQLEVYKKESDVPNQAVPNRMELGAPPPFAGLTEDQLKAEMKKREEDAKPVETTPIGKSEDEFSQEPKSETPKVEEVVEPVEAAEPAKRGRKAKPAEETKPE